MSDQQMQSLRQQPLSGATDAVELGSPEQLEASRAQLDRLFSAADSILAGLREQDNTRFLEGLRQAGGQ